MENYVSLSRILEEVYQDEEYGPELDWGDAVTWAGKALRLIAAPAAFIEKTTGNSLITPNITIEDYRGSLPIDFLSVLPGGVRDVDTKMVYDSNRNSFATRAAIQNVDSEHNTGRQSYILKDRYIEVNKQEATIELAYKAFAIDDNGFPMVPDNERVMEAIKKFIIFRQDHKLWRKNKLSENVYRDSEREWLWYVGSAQTGLRIMDPDRRAVWTKHWTRLLPTLNHLDFSNAFLGNQEDLNIGFNNVK